MIISAEKLREKWRSAESCKDAYYRIGSFHNLEWHLGHRDVGERALMLLSPVEMTLLPSSKSISVTKGYREDGYWTLSFVLSEKTQEEVFETLCADLINFSQGGSSQKQVLSRLAKRYHQWNLLLAHQKSGLLSESERKGLFGELTYLSFILKQGNSPQKSIQGWVGPDGADQDFVYADGWYEIKSVGAAAECVTISSLQQLDSELPGKLVVMRIDKCAPEHQKGKSLLSLVHEILDIIQTSPDAIALFESKLMNYGFIALPDYAEYKYHFSGVLSYNVDEAFPRLTAKNVPIQVSSVQYTVSLAGIEAWKEEV